MMTARTSTLMPLEMTLPRTRSAMNADLANRPKGISTKPASVVSLNSIRVTKSWTARMKKASSTRAQANSKQSIWMKFSKKAIQPIRLEMESSSGRPASRPVCATRPGRMRSSTVNPVPDAFRPSPAKLSKSARLFQLPMM